MASCGGEGEAGDPAGGTGFPFWFEIRGDEQEAGFVSDGNGSVISVSSGEESEAGEGVGFANPVAGIREEAEASCGGSHPDSAGFERELEGDDAVGEEVFEDLIRAGADAFLQQVRDHN
jgi:hypothetical protein